ncbi:MAG: CDP-glucose 4,6-dehydratase, partial [Chitinivibrionales bacterium]|nr:CDP-glucose 4,6-dehydratase [Chitinivibrionales bacterium]
KKHKIALATARAGNVIGGGDWATDRIVPDCIKAILAGKPIVVRNPHAVRPWQHVLEPLSGYLCLAENLGKDGPKYSGSWNFGPAEQDCQTVGYLVKTICSQWGPKAEYSLGNTKGPHEATFLKLDCSKAHTLLGWRPHWDLKNALWATVAWYKGCAERRNAREICLEQIDKYERLKQCESA